MNTPNSNVQRAIASELNSKLEDVKKELDKTAQNAIDNIKTGKIPSIGPVFENYTKDIRNNALMRHKTLKDWLPGRISRAINESVEVTPILELQKRFEKVQDWEKDKKSTQEKQKQIATQLFLTDYEKFQLYGEPDRNKKKEKRTASSNSFSEITAAVTKAYQNYVFQKKISYIIGIIVTLFCTAADFSIIYTFFQASNVTVILSITMSVIFAACLDAPPYILGALWTKRDDIKRLWYLQNDMDPTGHSSEVKRYNIIMTLAVIIFFVLFALYFAVRLITFFGGGDFNYALHAFLNGNLTFENSVFTSADLLTILTPLGTSVVAFAVGMMVFSSYTDYVKKAVVLINNGLEAEKEKCQEKIISYDTECKKINNDIDRIKDQIWTYYIGQEPMPESDNEFRQKASAAFQKFNVSLYRQTYETCSSQIRDAAELCVSEISRNFALFTKGPNMVMSMPFSDEEEKILDSIWVTKDGKEQNTGTANDIAGIERQIRNVTARLN